MPKQIREKNIETFSGTVNTVSAELIKDGASSGSRNFLTFADHIELTRGRKLVGAEESGSTPCLGLHSIEKVDGTDIMFRKNNTKLQYFKESTETWEDCKTGLTAGEEMCFANSFTPAGRQVWMSSFDGLFKLYPSSPTSVLDLTSSTENANIRGKILIEKSRMYGWGYKTDPTGLYASRVDRDSNYTLVASEAVGASGSTHYTGTFAHGKAFGIVFTSGSQSVTDDKNGNLIGGGTGTINYATGAYDVTFSTTTADPVTVSYLYEGSYSGFASFTYTSVRLAGEGNIQRQDSIGAKSFAVHSFSNKLFTLQDKGSWQITIDSTDLAWDNNVLRNQVGTPSSGASIATANGIVYVDTFDPETPKLKILSYDKYNELIVPYDLNIDSSGAGFDMSSYFYDKCAMAKFGDLALISCRTTDSQVNNKTIVFDMKLKSFGLLENGYNFFTVANSKLYGGDSSSPNVYELFSGWDDLEYNIEGEWESGDDRLGTEQLKKIKKIILSGYISVGQSFDIYASYDSSDYELLGSISGSDSYIDSGNSQTVGEAMTGADLIGGGGDEKEVFYYMHEIKISTTKFRKVRIKFVPTGIGYLSIYSYKHSDIRLKQFKLPKKYRVPTSVVTEAVFEYLLLEDGSYLLLETGDKLILN